MGDDKTLLLRINELEAALKEAENKLKNVAGDEELEAQLEETEKALEIVLRTRTELEQENQRLKQSLSDAELKYVALALEKDVEIVDVQLELRSASELQKQIDEKNGVIDGLQQQIAEYKKGLCSLQEWCVEKAKANAVADARLEHRSEQIEALELQTTELQYVLDDERKTVLSLKELCVLNDALLAESAAYEQALESQLQASRADTAFYKKAFEELRRLFIDNEAQAASKNEELTRRVAELQETVEQNAAFLAPRWKKPKDAKKTSFAALNLVSRHEFITATMLRAENQFLAACVPSEIWAVEVHTHKIAVTLLRLVYKADAFVDYIFNAHYEDLVLDAQDNVLSVAKDCSFLRWLHDAVNSIAKLQSLLSQFYEGLRRLSVPQAVSVFCIQTGNNQAPSDNTQTPKFSSDEWVAATSQLMVLLERGEHHLNLLLEAAQNEYLSAAFDIAVFDAFAKNIDAYISDAAARGFPLELVSPIYASEEGKQFGILPPVLSSLARRFASAAVVGLCEATYTKQAAKALPPDVWLGIWDASKHLCDWIPFGRTPSILGVNSVHEGSVLTVGFGLLKFQKRAHDREMLEQFLSSTTQALEALESELREIEETETAHIFQQLQKQIPVIGLSLEKINSMCQAFAPPRQADIVSLWGGAIELVLQRIFNVTAVQRELDHTKRALEATEKELKTITANMVAKEQELVEWQKKCSTSQLELERALLLGPELEEKRAVEAQYAQLLSKERQLVTSLGADVTKAKEENGELSARLEEATRILEASKHVSLHRHQESDWEAVEIANLKAIAQKYERELLALQMVHVERDLPVQNLGTSCFYLKQMEETSAQLEQEPNSSTENALGNSVAGREIAFLLKDYRTLQRGIMQHLIKPPLISPEMTPEEREKQCAAYREKRLALVLNLERLKSKTDEHFKRLASGRRPSKEFGEARCVPPEFQFLDLLTKAGSIKPSFTNAAPTMKITIPSKRFPLGSQRTDAKASLCKLAATATQLRELERRFLARV